MKTWIWNGAALATLVALAFAWSEVSGREEQSRIAPYRFPLSTAVDTDADIAFLQERVARAPEGLDLAALAGAFLRKARRTGQSRWILEAENAARRSLETLPVSNPGARLALAHAAQMKHDFARSIALCEQVLQERPHDARALSLKATALWGLGRLDDALLCADPLVDRAPISENLGLRAGILAARGDEREALHDFAKAAALEEPGDAEGSSWMRALWARLALRRGRLDEAEDLLREALRIRPFQPLALGLLGDLELGRGRFDAAEAAYRDAHRVSGDPVFLARRARVRRRRGDAAGAEEFRSAAEKALRESPGHRIPLAQVLLERGTPDADREALAIAEAEATRRRNAETLETLARALLAADRLEDARRAVREALRGAAPEARLHELAADIETRLGCPSRARMHRDAAREIHP
jgi:tetratricopeptide (TPR) repeat protein